MQQVSQREKARSHMEHEMEAFPAGGSEKGALLAGDV
jgi:hypothetical protein